jgi:micrococcal nuclease
MFRLAVALPLALALAVLLPSPAAARARARGAAGALTLDGARVGVRWTDGDTFKVVDGPFRGVRGRVIGFNTLETWGPVHRWGRWAPEELLAIARGAGPRAAAGTWSCRRLSGQDRYGRLKVACPELARALVTAGEAHVFAMDEAADPALVAAQRDAQRRGAGMWAKGVPALVVTSAHSADEDDLGRRGAYDRVADTRTGTTRALPHARRYGACEEVCAGEGTGRSCFVYVPPERRYRDRPACLREPAEKR